MTQTMQENAAIGVYDSHEAAEEAVKQLQRSGFNMKQLSIVGKGYQSDEQVIGYYTTGDRMKHWGGWGAFWGGMWGWLTGAAFFMIPGLGPVLVAGPLVAWLVAALEGAAIFGGLSALGAALYSIGIPKDSVLKMETAVKADKFLVIAHGPASDTERAREILHSSGASEIFHHEDVHANTGATV